MILDLRLDSAGWLLVPHYSVREAHSTAEGREFCYHCNTYSIWKDKIHYQTSPTVDSDELQNGALLHGPEGSRETFSLPGGYSGKFRKA
ncbi:hypothetical protein FHG87_022738 [Trinorchestia longiramus]|nr:hypothetical protein FHG87_022738 [Trinorchestia longiramus]